MTLHLHVDNALLARVTLAMVFPQIQAQEPRIHELAVPTLRWLAYTHLIDVGRQVEQQNISSGSSQLSARSECFGCFDSWGQACHSWTSLDGRCLLVGVVQS